MLKNEKGELVSVEWEDALISVAKALRNAGSQTAAVAGGLADAEVRCNQLFSKISVMSQYIWEVIAYSSVFVLGPGSFEGSAESSGV